MRRRELSFKLVALYVPLLSAIFSKVVSGICSIVASVSNSRLGRSAPRNPAGIKSDVARCKKKEEVEFQLLLFLWCHQGTT